VNFNDLKLAESGEQTSHSIWTRLSRWAHHTLELLDSAPANQPEIYMRWPGERMPAPEPRRRWRWGNGRRDDLELAA
jgi:hypothetical protein